MVVVESPKLFNVQYILEGYLCLLKIFLIDYISFSFYVKYIWKRCYKNFFGTFFWVPIPFKWYQNTSECGTVN